MNFGEQKPDQVDIVEVMAERYGVDTETCRTAREWSKEWWSLIDDLEPEEATADILHAARDVAADSLGDALKRDVNGVPTYRSQYLATEYLYSANIGAAETMRSLLEEPGIRPRPNFGKLDEILGILLEQHANNGFPYHLEAAQLPQDERNMPETLPRGGKDHANFLFTTCYYMRGGIKSFAAFRALSRLYETDPDLFEPSNASQRDSKAIAEALQSVGLGFASDVISKQWVQNATRLEDLYEGDPRNIFAGDPDYPELLRRIQNKNGNGFAGFQEKMTSMLAYYLMAEDLIPYFDFPLPVDFHVLRVSAATGIIEFDDIPTELGVSHQSTLVDKGGFDIYHPKTLAMLRSMYHDYSVTHGVSQLDVCNAVWSLSSAICGRQPGNIMREPDRANGRNGRKTEIYPLVIDINNLQQQAAYNRSCALCPIEEHCEQNFPSKTYYVQGKMIGTPRIRFPKTTLF